MISVEARFGRPNPFLLGVFEHRATNCAEESLGDVEKDHTNTNPRGRCGLTHEPEHKKL